MAFLGLVNAALALCLAGACAALWRKARSNGLRRAPTWDCGYAAPDARMQYTGGSFGRTASDWFSWVLRPERAMRRPRGPFPPNTVLTERVPETVLERIVSPAAEAVMWLSHGARRLQHGRIQFYIVYLVGGITVLAAIALLG